MGLDFFGELLDPVDGVVDAITGKIEDALDAAFDGVEAALEAIVDKAITPIDGAIDSAANLIRQVETRILDAVDALIDSVDEPLDFITDKVTAVPDIILDGVEDIVSVVTDKVTDLLDIGIGAIEDTVGTLFTRAGELASFALDGLTAALENVKDAFATGAEVIAEGAQNALTGLFPGFLDFLAPDMSDRLEAIVNDFENTPGIPADIKAITAPGALPIAGAGALVLVLGIYPAVAALVNAGLTPYMELLTQRVMAKARPTLLPAGDAIRAQRRGLTSPDHSNDQMARGGWSQENIATLRALDQSQLNVQESLGMWLRELITDEELMIQLTKLGFGGLEIDTLRTLAFPIPGIQDIVQMAVREVFSPEIAERFGQFEEIPPDYLLWANRSGLTEFWARNIWAAHWVLPSVQAGYEMLHRGVISQEDLQRLFVAQDIMPFWRDKLIAISFNPFTRVDIRRMHATDILSDSEVFTAYQDIGYDPEKAQKLTDFTLALTAAGRREPAAKERDLTKTEILGLLREKLLEPDEVGPMLLALGFDEQEAELLISREMVKRIAGDRKRLKALIFDKFRSGQFTFDQAQEALVTMELGAFEQSEAVTDLSILRDTRDALPTKTDLEGFLTDLLITEEQYRETMRLLGFSELWIDVFLAQIREEEAEELAKARKEEADPAVKERDLTKTDILGLLRDKILEQDKAKALLLELGFDEQEVSLLISRVLTKQRAANDNTTPTD